MNGMRGARFWKVDSLLPSRLQIRAPPKLWSQPGGKHQLVWIFAHQPQSPGADAAPRKTPRPKIVWDVCKDLPPFSAAQQISHIRPHLKVHEVVGAFSREQNPAIGGNVTVGARNHG